MTGANGFLKKNECTVVWAAFRDRNFEVGLPKAMSVPSKYNNFSHTQVNTNKTCIFKKNTVLLSTRQTFRISNSPHACVGGCRHAYWLVVCQQYVSLCDSWSYCFLQFLVYPRTLPAEEACRAWLVSQKSQTEVGLPTYLVAKKQNDNTNTSK